MPSVQLAEGVLLKALKIVEHAICRDATRLTIFEVVAFRVRKVLGSDQGAQYLEVSATDGHRLALVSITLGVSFEDVEPDAWYQPTASVSVLRASAPRPGPTRTELTPSEYPSLTAAIPCCPPPEGGCASAYKLNPSYAAEAFEAAKRIVGRRQKLVHVWTPVNARSPFRLHTEVVDGFQGVFCIMPIAR